MKSAPKNSLRISACIIFFAGCGTGPVSPSAPGGSPNVATSPQPSTHIQGFITDITGVPVELAVIQVADGPNSGLTSVTNETGRFEMSGGVAAQKGSPVTLRITREDYQPRTVTAWWWQVTGVGSERQERFWLDRGPALNLDPGSYTLTIKFDPAHAAPWLLNAPCAGFPANLASRSFPVTVTSSHMGFPDDRSINLDPPFAKGLGFGLSLIGRFASFEIDFPIVEEFEAFRYLEISGVAPTTSLMSTHSDGPTLEIPFTGSFSYCQARSSRGAAYCQHLSGDQTVAFHTCSSDRATMIFAKR